MCPGRVRHRPGEGVPGPAYPARVPRGLVVDDLGVLRAAPGLPPDPAGVLAVVLAARGAGVRVGVLSNADDVDPAAGFEGFADVVHVSGRTGRRKPDPAAFLGCARALGVAPADCVAVDDLPANVRAAVAVGMVGVLHRSAEQTAEELRVLLDLPV